ncbi:MAG TPA: patatin-like phospholipase family protein [Rhodanobacteraceae bacterium]|nr:patatin-like phospholipase family protein [Rhodanobacteraceae bacterium]
MIAHGTNAFLSASKGDSVCREDLLVSDLFACVEETTLLECMGRAEILEFKRGEALVHEGGPPDAFYVVVTGRVEVVLQRPDAETDLIDILGCGDCVGDMALLLNQPRSATVRALRDSRVVRLPAADFRWLLLQSPPFTLRLAQTLGLRLQRTTHRRHRERPIETIAVVALAGVGRNDFCRGVAQAIACAVCADCPVQDAAKDAIGDTPGYRVIACDPALTSATLGAIRAADLVLIAVDSAEPRDTDRIAALRDAVADIVPLPRIELALLRNDATAPCGTRNWLRGGAFSSWHHLRRSNPDDFARMARRLVGRATGVVLSGGGARGFAHIGVLRAFDEIGMPIDFVAGTSMGAIIAAQYAAGYSHAEMIEIARESYLRRSRPSEFSLPYVSIHNGSGTNRRLERMFGGLRIENLPTAFFCVSSNLSTAEAVVHERGKLWLATRSSCSVPGLLPPVRHRGEYLVDGGLLDNLPVSEMRARCRGRVIAADVSVALDLKDSVARPVDWRRRRRFSALLAPPRMPGIGSILTRTMTLGSVRDARAAGTPADIYLHPPVDDIGMGDFARLEEIVERGWSHARACLTDCEAA